MENEQTKLEIREVQGKEGRVFKNINLKPRTDRKTGAPIPGLIVGQHIIVEKLFPDGHVGFKGQGYTIMNYTVKYLGEDVSFSLIDGSSDTSEAKQFEATGGVGDKVKIEMTNHTYTYEGKEKSTLRLKFSKVE